MAINTNFGNNTIYVLLWLALIIAGPIFIFPTNNYFPNLISSPQNTAVPLASIQTIPQSNSDTSAIPVAYDATSVLNGPFAQCFPDGKLPEENIPGMAIEGHSCIISHPNGTKTCIVPYPLEYCLKGKSGFGPAGTDKLIVEDCQCIIQHEDGTKQPFDKEYLYSIGARD